MFPRPRPVRSCHRGRPRGTPSARSSATARRARVARRLSRMAAPGTDRIVLNLRHTEPGNAPTADRHPTRTTVPSRGADRHRRRHALRGRVPPDTTARPPLRVMNRRSCAIRPTDRFPTRETPSVYHSSASARRENGVNPRILLRCRTPHKVPAPHTIPTDQWTFHAGCAAYGARGRTRTDISLRMADFESAASTNSATRAAVQS